MPKFLSDDYFRELETALVKDPKWNETTRGVKTSIIISVTDTNQSYLLGVENGVTSLQKAAPETQAEFSFDGTYDAWARVAQGGLDMQTAVLKGQLKFKGSITKVLFYRDRFLRITELLKGAQTEF